MADGTKIEWCDASLNPIMARNRKTGAVGHYCEHASDGCRHCYSETFNQRGIGAGVLFRRQNRDQVELFFDERKLCQPLHWRRPRRIFWNSMTDTFGEFVPSGWIDRQFAVAALTPQHTHLFLTKRAERMRKYFAGPSFGMRVGGELMRSARGNLSAECAVIDLVHQLTVIGTPLRNCVLGVSAEDQPRADERREHLAALAQMGWRTFVSYEPAIGPVDWRGWEFLSWLISGGESGPHARPSHPDWHRAARDQCAAAGVAFFMKQMTKKAPIPDDIMIREFPDAQ